MHMHMYMSMAMYTYKQIIKDTHTHTHQSISISVRIYRFTYRYEYRYTCILTCTYTCIHVCVYVYTYIYFFLLCWHSVVVHSLIDVQTGAEAIKRAAKGLVQKDGGPESCTSLPSRMLSQASRSTSGIQAHKRLCTAEGPISALFRDHSASQSSDSVHADVGRVPCI